MFPITPESHTWRRRQLEGFSVSDAKHARTRWTPRKGKLPRKTHNRRPLTMSCEKRATSFSLYLVITSIVTFLPIPRSIRQFEGRRSVRAFCCGECECFRFSESDGESESGNDDCAVRAVCTPQIICSAINAYLKILSDTTIFLSETRFRMSSVPWAITKASIVQRAA